MTSQVMLNVGLFGRVLRMVPILFTFGCIFVVGTDTVNDVLPSFSSSSSSSSASEHSQVIAESYDVVVTSSSFVPSSVDLLSSSDESSSGESSDTSFSHCVACDSHSSSMESSHSSESPQYESSSSTLSSSSGDYNAGEWRNNGLHKSKQPGRVGRPPAVLEAPPNRSNPAPTNDGDDSAIVGNDKGRRRPTPHDREESATKMPGRQWDGPPSPHRLRGLRTSDAKYLDLYLCGQFLHGYANASADDFAVISFNYAGRTRPFSPCSKLDFTTETVNYVYRTGLADNSAFQQVVDDLPKMWKRQVSTKSGNPRVVHLFTFHLPASIADLSHFLRLRAAPPYRSARFVLGYVNRKAPVAGSSSARDFLDVLRAFKRAKIDVIRVCGRCAQVARYPLGGRRRRAMAYGMSVLSENPRKSECRPIQEIDVPGAYLFSDVCDSFQRSVIRCALRSLKRRCPQLDTNTPSSGIDNDEALFQSVNDLIQLCDVDAECWRREAQPIRELIEPTTRERCNMPAVAIGKMFGKCAAAASGIPPEP